MTKSEITRQLAAASNAARVADMGRQIEALRQARLESAEQLATMLEPLAQAMAALTDETRETLAEIAQRGKEQGERFQAQLEAANKASRLAAMEAQAAARSIQEAGRRMDLTHYLLALATGLVTAMLVSAFWLWLAPPSVKNQLDPQAVAEYLRPAIEAVKRSKGK
ncbi:MAG: IncQ-type mobilization protein MobB [Telluria sp.]